MQRPRQVEQLMMLTTTLRWRLWLEKLKNGLVLSVGTDSANIASCDFKREHFHLLNVTPDRPCTAFFKVPQEFTTKTIFESLLRTGITANEVCCLQRRPTDDVVVTFSIPEHRDHFLQHSPLIERRSFPTHPDSDNLVFLTVYDAPYELSDTAIKHRLHPFCKVYSRHRSKLQGYSGTCNGSRHYRVSLHRSVPCYMRFGKFQL